MDPGAPGHLLQIARSRQGSQIMTRWILRLAGLSAIIGLGWFGVIWAQQKFSAHDAPLPDLTKDPVNAGADGLLNGTYKRAASSRTDEAAPSYRDDRTTAGSSRTASSDRTPVDPFHAGGATADTQTSYGGS